MRRTRIGRISLQMSSLDAHRAARIARRAAELLGEQLAAGDVVAPSGKLSVSVSRHSGLTDEQVAKRVAVEVRKQLR